MSVLFEESVYPSIIIVFSPFLMMKHLNYGDMIKKPILQVFHIRMMSERLIQIINTLYWVLKTAL